jgi:hypothetical protein
LKAAVHRQLPRIEEILDALVIAVSIIVVSALRRRAVGRGNLPWEEEAFCQLRIELL